MGVGVSFSLYLPMFCARHDIECVQLVKPRDSCVEACCAREVPRHAACPPDGTEQARAKVSNVRQDKDR